MPSPLSFNRDRVRGALIGLAVGDALGTTVEFQPPGSFEPVTDMIGGGVFRLQPGEWTDDTSMALCLAQSLVDCRGFNARDQMTKYCDWRQRGYLSSTGRCFDIGNTVSAALRRFILSGKAMAGSAEPHTAGNGSIMRLAPVPMFWRRDAEEAVRMAAESSRTTHAAPAALDACRYLAGLLVGAMGGAPKDELLASHYEPAAGLWVREPLSLEIARVAAGSFAAKSPPAIRGTGHAVASLEAALWAFRRGSSFEEAVLLAVNLGDDADTTAAVCGQLAGAHYGESAIPARWREKLALREKISQLADDLVRLGAA